MLMKFFKHVTKNVVIGLGLLALAFIIFTCMPFIGQISADHRLALYEYMIKVTKDCILLSLSVSVVEFIVLSFELISQSKWIRRLIVISYAIGMGLIVLYRNGMFKMLSSKIIVPAIALFIIASAFFSVLGYWAEDKKHKKDIADINEKLKELNGSDTQYNDGR